MKKKTIAGKVLTAVGYVKAPRATFMLKHPVKGLSALVAYRAAKRVAPKRRTVAAAAAAAVAVPVMWRTIRSS